MLGWFVRVFIRSRKSLPLGHLQTPSSVSFALLSTPSPFRAQCREELQSLLPIAGRHSQPSVSSTPQPCPSTGNICKIKKVTIFSKNGVSTHTSSASLWQRGTASCLRQGCEWNSQGMPPQNHYSGDRNSPVDACDSCSQRCFYYFLESASLHKISDRNSCQRPLRRVFLRKGGAADPRRSRRSVHTMNTGLYLPP